MDPISALMSLVLSQPESIEKTSEKVEVSVQTTSSINANNSTEINHINNSTSGCKVYNPFGSYVVKIDWDGECKDGYAEGKGKSIFYYIDGEYEKYTSTVNYVKGKYTGPFTTVSYNADHSVRTYISGYDVDNRIDGYGGLTIPQTEQNEDYVSSWQSSNIGKLVNGSYVVEGLFKDGNFVKECKKEECPKN